MSSTPFKRWPAVLLACAAAITGTWTMRFIFAPGAEVARRPGLPALREAQRSPATVNPMQDVELLSVKMGLVEWPVGGDPAAVAAAFADAWRKLRPLAEAGSRDGNDENENKARQLFADWWKLDPAAVLRFVSEPPGVFMERGGWFMLPLMASSDPRKAWKLSDFAMGPYERMMARAEVMRAWAIRAPQEAMAFAASLSGAQQPQAERAALSGWIALNAGDAIAWVAALAEGWRKGVWLEAVTFESAVSDPASFAAALRSGKVSGQAFNLLLKHRRESGGEAVADIARAAIASDPDPLGFCTWATDQGKVKVFSEINGVKTWDFADGGQELNCDSSTSATEMLADLEAAADARGVYFAWSEPALQETTPETYSPNQVRIVHSDGSNIWRSLDGDNPVEGLNLDATKPGGVRDLQTLGGKVYLVWSEDYSIRAAVGEWGSADEFGWTQIDGGGPRGNVQVNEAASGIDSSFGVLRDQLFAFTIEGPVDGLRTAYVSVGIDAVTTP